MRCLVWVVLAACSADPRHPDGAPVMPCPRSVSHDLPWTRDVFPACAPPGVPKFCTSCTPCTPPKPYVGTITRDAQGRITRVATKHDELSEYTYDATGRVISLDDWFYGHAELVYDEAGWLAEERTRDGVWIYHYDARGRATLRAQAARSIRVRYAGERVVEITDAGKPLSLACE